MYVYRKSEEGLWTVGFYTPAGEWIPQGDYKNETTAIRRVNFLNGGGASRMKPIEIRRKRGGNRGKRGPSPAVQERNEKIRADRMAGLSPREISAKYGIHLNNVYTIIRGLNAPPVPCGVPSPAIKANRNEEIVQAYRDGLSSVELAERFGVSRERVCQILRRTNEIALASERKRIARAALAAERQQIASAALQDWNRKVDAVIAGVKNGRSISDVGRDLGLTGNEKSKIGKVLRANGIPIRHGKHGRDWSAKIARVRELRASGYTWDRISEICDREGHGNVVGSWASIHTPDLVKAARPKKAPKRGARIAVLPSKT